MASDQNMHSSQKELKGAPALPVSRALQRLMDKHQLSAAHISREIEQMDIPVLAGYFDRVELYVDLMRLTEGEKNDVKREDSTHVAMIQCLTIWRRTNPAEATFQALLEMLLKLNKESIAAEVFQYFSQQYLGDPVVTDQPTTLTEVTTETNSATNQLNQSRALGPNCAVAVDGSSVTNITTIPLKETNKQNDNSVTKTDAIISRITAQVEALEAKFQALTCKAYEHLKQIGISLEDFYARVSCMSVTMRHVAGNYFKKTFHSLGPDSTLAALWGELNSFWDFLNYELFHHVIRVILSDNPFFHEVKEYVKEIQDFSASTKLHDFFKAWPFSIEKPQEKEIVALKQIVIRVNKPWDECTLHDVKSISSAFAQGFFLPREFLLVAGVGKSSVAILCYIPPSMANSIEEQLKQGKEHFLADNSFLSITINGDIVFSLTPMKQCSLEMRNKYSRFSSKAETAKHSLIPFKLALIGRKKLNKYVMEKFTRNSLRGDKDDIHYKKSPTTINTLGYLPNGSPARLVLVEGAPGVGKTTFSRQVCLKWANKELLKHITVLFLIPLRDFNLQNISTLQGLLSVITPDMSLVEELEANKGEGLAFWLDGWDEIASTLIDQSSIYEHLVSGKVLPNSLLIVSSRPWATADIKKQLDRQPSQHIEIVSSVQHQIDWLVEQKELQSLRSKASAIVHRFVKYLDQTLAVKGNMHTPLASDITFKVYQWCQESNSPLPTTATELYNCYTVLCIHRYLDNHPRFGPLKLWKSNDLNDLPEPFKTWFVSMCRLANDGLRDGQRLMFPDVPSQLKLETLGLMEPQDPLYASEESTVVSYHYKHLTLQEFLVAKLLSWLGEEEQSEFVQKCIRDGRFSMVLRFLSGLCRSSPILRDRIRRILDSHWLTLPSSLEDRVLYEPTIFHWLFEGGDKAAIAGIPGEREIKVDPGLTWSNLDYHVTGHCIARSNCSWDIYFCDSYMGDEKMTQFFQALSSAGGEQGNAYITSLNLCSSDLTTHSLYCLQTIPAHILRHLKVLDVSDNKLDSTALDHITQVVPNMPQLETLDMSVNPGIQRGGAVTLLSTLYHHTTLKKLNLSGTNIAEEDCEQLAEILSSSHCIEQLDVSGNTLSSDSLLILFRGIQRNNSLIKLVVNSFSSHQCSIPLEVMKILSTYLQDKERCKLEELVLYKSNITAEKATLLAQGLSQNCSVKELDLYANPLKDIGVAALAQALSENKTITKLYLFNCHITSTGGVALASCLMANSTLEELDISSNSLAGEAIQGLSQLLQCNKNLKRLDIRYDDSLSQSDIDTLLSSLRDNQTLEVLWLPIKFRVDTNNKRVKWW